MPLDLWPPIGSIRRALAPPDAGDADPGADAPPAEWPMHDRRDDDGAPAGATAAMAPLPRCASADLLLPLAELARRRGALAARAFPAQWAAGRLVGVRHDGLLHGVLLARDLGNEHWHGWLAASEADWAGPHDVLLEPTDEPFEPQFGVIQVWNPVVLRAPRPDTVRVLGEVSATRLAALQAVHEEAQAGQAQPIDAAPGRIALRSVAGGTFRVLCGTPLGDGDPRAGYQALYRAAAARLSVVPLPRHGAAASAAADDTAQARAAGAAPQAGSTQAALPPAPVPVGSDVPPRPASAGPLARLRRWFGAEPWLRPAFALLALVVVVQNAGLLTPDAAEEADSDAVHFRDLSGGPRAAFDVVVTWKRGVAVDDSAQLLRQLSASVVAGPDAQGRWYLRLPEAQRSAQVLRDSPLVGTVVLP